MKEIMRISWDEESGRPVVELIKSDWHDGLYIHIDDVMHQIFHSVDREIQLKKNDDWYKSLKESLR